MTAESQKYKSYIIFNKFLTIQTHFNEMSNYVFGGFSMTKPSLTLVFTGSLTISQSETIQAPLLDALAQHSSIEIDCSDSEEIDVSFLQILISASRRAVAYNKNLSLSSPPCGSLSEAMSRCGLPVNIAGLQKAPPVGMRWQPEFISGIGKWHDEFIVVPNLSKIFN